MGYRVEAHAAMLRGLAWLDAEHEEQLERIRRVQDLIAERRTPAEIGRAIEDLVGYLETHFVSEQIVMRERAYPDRETHIEEHDRAVLMLRELEARCKAGDASSSAATIEALGEWLVSHIRTADRQLAEYLPARGSRTR